VSKALIVNVLHDVRLVVKRVIEWAAGHGRVSKREHMHLAARPDTFDGFVYLISDARRFIKHNQNVTRVKSLEAA
jgi:hypothetical protein